MNRAQLEHVLRAAATIIDDPDILVIGSQAILGAYPEDRLPVEATTSIEADLAFFGDPDGAKADRLDGAIGELSRFHETFGYYAQGVSVSTAVLPAGWEDRTVEFAPPGAAPRSSRARCGSRSMGGATRAASKLPAADPGGPRHVDPAGSGGRLERPHGA